MNPAVGTREEYERRYRAAFETEPRCFVGGVPSVTDRREPPPDVPRDVLEPLLEALEDRSLRAALRETVDSTAAPNTGGSLGGGGAVRRTLVDDGATAWRTPVSAFLGGRCLDVNCGFGARACLLAELHEEVYACDPSPEAVRFLAARDDYDSADSVTPFHGDPASMPTPTDPFDTVVVDITGRNRPDDVAGRLDRLRSLVTPDGVLLVLFDGRLPLPSSTTPAAERDARPEGEDEPGQKTGAGRGNVPELQDESESDAEVGSETGPEPDTEVAAEADPEADIEADSEVDPEADIEADSEVDPEDVAETDSETDTVEVAETDSEGVAESDPEVPLDSRSKHGAEAGPNRGAGTGPSAEIPGLFERLGFGAVDRYALVPDATDPSCCFRVDDRDAATMLAECAPSLCGNSLSESEDGLQELVEAATETERDPGSGRDRGADPSPGEEPARDANPDHGPVGHRGPDPAYLAICRDPTVSGVARSGLVVDGSTCSVVLDGADDVESVTKAPSRAAHGAYVTASNVVLDAVDDDPEELSGTLPRGSTSRTRLGPTRVEPPLEGRTLSLRLDDENENEPDPGTLADVLELGLEWLATFQRHNRRDPQVLPSPTVEAALSVPALDLHSPAIDEGVELFDCPAHGDFRPANVFVDDGAVSGVVAWGRADPAAIPVVDAGHFVLESVRRSFGTVPAGVDAALAAEGPYADVVVEALAAYCDAVGLSRRAVVTCLPLGWLHRIRIDIDRGATPGYTDVHAVTEDVQYVHGRHEDIVRVLVEES